MVSLDCCHPRVGSIFKMWAYISLVNIFQDFSISTRFCSCKFSHDVHFFLLALASAGVICCFQVIILSKVTRRYDCCSSILSGVSSNVSLPGWIFGESVKRVPVVFNTPLLGPCDYLIESNLHSIVCCGCILGCAPECNIVCIKGCMYTFWWLWY